MRHLAALPFILIAACKCLDVPVSDTSPPTAGLTIEWRDANGRSQSQSFTQASSNTTIDANKRYEVAVLYTGGDDQGLRSIHLEYDMSYSTGTSIVQPLLVAIEVVSSCPRKLLLDSHNFDPGEREWNYTFKTRSENWLGLSTRSATIRVQAR